ncbi:MAG TPA: Do family serine endopeptidase [Nitrospiria bacterium]|jgi:serine protease Do
MTHNKFPYFKAKVRNVFLPLLFFGFTFFPFPTLSYADQSGTVLLGQIENVFTEIADTVTPAVVNISPLTDGPESLSQSPRRHPDAPGSGSGVIIDPSGFIVTNKHVVGDATSVSVGLSDRSRFTGKVIGRDTDTDIAVVKISGNHNFPFVPLGNSDKLKVGQWVIAVGNPFGLDRTVTVGIISGLGREQVNLTRFENFIQTDASINPGNSGGPLFNIQGEVVGINTAIINFAQGIGFAIPSNMTENIVRQLRTTGKVARGWLGVGIQPLTEELSSKFGADETEGVLVNEIFEGDPAERGGIQAGDIITKIGEKKVTTPRTLARIIAGVMPGEKIKIDVIRNQKHKILSVVLGERKDGVVPASNPSLEKGPNGIHIQELTKALSEKFGVDAKSGVLITEIDPDSPAAEGGLKQGDVIQEINREKVGSPKEFNQILKKVKKEEDLLFRIIRENRGLFLVVKPREK